MCHQHVQALDTIRHPTAGKVGSQRFDRVPLGKVRLVCPSIGRGKFRILGQAFGHFTHDAGGFLTARFGSQSRVREVVQRRERCSVRKLGGAVLTTPG